MAVILDERGRTPIDNLIEADIERRMKKKSWPQLDKCLQWKLVTAYLQTLDEKVVEDIRGPLRELVNKNALTGVEYNNQEMRLVNIDLASIS